MKKIACVFVLMFAFCGRAPAEDENQYCLSDLTLIGSRTITDRSKIGKAITVVDGVEDDWYMSLTDSLREVEGVRVKRVDGISGLTTVRIRGLRSIDTLLMFDGSPLRDPSDPQGSANPLFGDLSPAGIERIEVLRGPSSALYGSAAQAGVINMVLSGREGFRAFSEYGTFNTFREGVEVGAKDNKYGDHFVSIERTDSEGFDAHDGYEHSQIVGKSSVKVADAGRLSFAYLLSRSDAALNNSPSVKGGILQNDSDDENDTREYSLGHYKLAWDGSPSDSVAYSVRAAYTDSERRFTFLTNEDGSGFDSDGSFEGQELNLQEQVTFRHSEKFSTTVGHEYDREFLKQSTFLNGKTDWFGSPLHDLKEKTDQYRNDYFAEEVVKFGPTTLTLAGRINTHETAKSRTTVEASISHIVKEWFTVLRAHVGTAYREPSLFETDGSFLTSFGRFAVGNKALSPERSRAFDIGFEQPFKNLTFGSTFFRHDYTNKIDFVGSGYRNVEGQEHTFGFESFLSAAISENISARVSHTHTEGSRLFDIPEDQFAGSITADFGKLHGEISGLIVGDHRILVFNEDTWMVDQLGEEGNVTFNAKISYDLNKNTTLYIRGENILGEDYTDGGFRTPGARVYGGAVISF